MLSLSLPLLLSLAGCSGDATVNDKGPDPTGGNPAVIQDPNAPTGPGTGDAAMGGTPGAPPEGGAPPVVDPANGGPPPAGADGAPVPGAATGARPTPAGFTLEPGKTVKLSGTTSYNGTKTGVLRLDFLRQPAGAQFPELLHTISQPKPGAWEIEVPKNAGDITVAAYIDSNDNGPEPSEPGAVTDSPVKIAGESVSGIKLDIVDAPPRDPRKPAVENDLNGGAAAAAAGPPVVGAKPGDGGAKPADGAAKPGVK